MKSLRLDARHVLETLVPNDEHGNQYIVVRSLTKPAIDKSNRISGGLGSNLPRTLTQW